MKRLLLILGFLGLGAGMGLWILLRESPPPPPVILSDGTVIQWRGVTFGTNHICPGGSVGHRLARLVPQFLRPRLGLRTPIMATTRPVIVVWTSARHPLNRTAYPRYMIGGEAGFAPVNSSSSISSAVPGADTIEGWGFDTYPRRGDTVILRIYEPESNWQDMKLKGEFKFRNPAPQRQAPWAAERLPITRTNEEFAVTLLELLAGVDISPSGTPRPPRSEPETGVRAVFRMNRNGKPTSEWAPVGVRMSDPTGNTTGSMSWTGNWRDQDFVAGFTPLLWTDESAWRLKFEFSRLTNFAATELWTVSGVPASPTVLSNNAAFGTNLQGASVQLESVQARGLYGFDNTSRSWSVKFRIKPNREDYRFTVVQAVDEQGRAAPPQGSSWGSGDHSFDFGVKTNATSLTITLALHRSRFEEFQVKPVRWPNNTPPAATR